MIEAGSRDFVSWSFANAVYDEARGELAVGGEVVAIERKPLDVLGLLLRHAGEVLTKDELLDGAWPGRVVGEASLTNAIGKLRAALRDEDQRVIVTVPKLGYRLDGVVSHKRVKSIPVESVLKTGDAVPRRPNYRLVERLARTEDSEVWKAEQPRSREVRVFKFSLDGSRLPSLKREVTLSRLLRDALGERDDFVRILDWDFEQAPFFLEAEFGGTSLDQWFDSSGASSTRALRLAFLAEVADAVAAAHSVGVLHKDLKPANILVRDDSDHAQPRLVDFGAGRLLEPGRLDALGITQLGLTQTQSDSGSYSGTPLYLAPEVIAGRAPSIRSDLYSLGVILYQFVVGDFRRPLSPGWESDIDDPLLREDIAAFAQGDPDARPDSALDLAHRLRTLEERREAASRRKIELARLHEAERQLSLARARRPWIAVSMLVLVAGTSFSVLLAYRADQARQAAEAAESQARQAQEREALANAEASRNLERANNVNAFLVQDVIGAGDPLKTGERSPSLMDALRAAEANIPLRFAESPRAQAQVRQMLAQALAGHGDHAGAGQQFNLAAEAVQESPEAEDRTLALQNRLLQAGTLLNTGQLDAFDELMGPVLERVEADDQLEPRARLHAHFVAGQRAMVGGNIEEAQARLGSAHEILDTIVDPPPALTVRVQSIYAVILAEAGDNERASVLLDSAQSTATEVFGPTHPETVNIRILRGMALNRLSQTDEAITHLEALRSDLDAVDGTASEPSLDVDQLLAEAYTAKGDFTRALPMYRDALQRRTLRVGASNPQALGLAVQVAEAHRRGGDAGQALEIVLATLVEAESAPEALLETLRFVQACSLYSLGKHEEARLLAGKISVAQLAAREPQRDWAGRIERLTTEDQPAPSGDAVDPCLD